MRVLLSFLNVVFIVWLTLTGCKQLVATSTCEGASLLSSNLIANGICAGNTIQGWTSTSGLWSCIGNYFLLPDGSVPVYQSGMPEILSYLSLFMMFLLLMFCCEMM